MEKLGDFRRRTITYVTFLCAVLALLAGCASPATFEGMIPDRFDITQKRPETVDVVVSGGQETNAMWKPQISDEAFKQALIESIGKSQAFSKVIQGKDANFLLSVLIFNMEQPSFGVSLTVNLEAVWKLSRVDNGKTVWSESIKSENTAGFSDAFAAVKRLRIATEGAAQKNIAEGLARISKLNL
jgi:hypothetical protein